jgi:hypothetical protein
LGVEKWVGGNCQVVCVCERETNTILLSNLLAVTKKLLSVLDVQPIRKVLLPATVNALIVIDLNCLANTGQNLP